MEQAYEALAKISTKDLAEELAQRDGVEQSYAALDEDLTVTVNGAALVLVITD